ncbi:hypothetical protein HYW46_01290 [Candidatus Daviesbacteria bacterium]|nr:hypothetical protein [Candidatus Daviesbacteria bacterium]
MPELPAVLFLLLSLGTFLVVYYRILKKEEPKEEVELEKARSKGFQIIHNAIKKAQVILGEAEIEGIKVSAQTKLESKKIEERFDAQLGIFTDRLDKIQEDYNNYLNSLRVSAGTSEDKNNEVIRQHINQIFDRLEQSLVESFNQTQQQSIHTIEMEIQSARQLIERYKLQQLKLIDENIIALLESTLSLVLAKKLTLKDQLDLVYEALEKAKIEKFIV